jgi:ERF superfamily
MDLILQHKVERFGALAIAAGWEWCGVQESIPPVWPTLIIRKHGNAMPISFDPADFDPIVTALYYLDPEEKKMTETKLNLRQKLIQIYNEIDHVEKAGRNAKQNYNFVRAADVLRVVREAFAKYGVYAQTNFELLGTYDIKTNSGGNMHTATVKATIVLFDADSDETKTISGLGDGADGGDKGIYKAMTGSTKNALRNGFLLPDEADPEADESVDDRTSGKISEYTDFRGTSAMPDFQDARRGESRPTPAPRAEKPTPKPTPVLNAPQEAPVAEFDPKTAYSGESAAMVKSPAPERGDAWEEPETANDRLPTEEEITAFRAKFIALANNLSAHGNLTASKGLKLNTKLQVFMLSITKAPAAKNMTVSQWNDFFVRAKAVIDNPAVGLAGLTKLVNKANGLEEK